MGQPQQSTPSPESEIVGPDGKPARPQASESTLELDAQEGQVFLGLPSGKVMGFPPERAKALGGTLINLAREASKQRKRLDREAAQSSTTEGASS